MSNKKQNQLIKLIEFLKTIKGHNASNKKNKISRELEYSQSQKENIDLSQIKSVCLTLGPYRNLTTLTASLMFLHPSCQVLNHGAKRIFSREEVNFLTDYNDLKLQKFLKYAIFMSKGGSRGNYGGSITLSHAFDSDDVLKSYQNRYGNLLIKNNIECLYWKESMKVSNFIKNNNVDVLNLIKQQEKLRFILPIRNPLDCAISNCKTGHARHLISSKSKDYSVLEVLDSILIEIAWFVNLYNSCPDNFFYFFEYDITNDLFIKLAKFVDVETDQQWLEDCLKCSKVKKPYDHDRELIEHYIRSVHSIFNDNPFIRDELLKFSQ